MDSDPAILTGLLVIVIVVAVPLAFVAALALLAVYRRAVTRRMLLRGMAAEIVPIPNATPTGEDGSPARGTGPPSSTLGIVTLPVAGSGDALSGFVWRSAAVYLAAGLAFALVMAAAYLAANRLGFDWLVMLLLVANYAWPVVIAVALVASTSWLQTLLVALAYGLILGGIAALAIQGTGISPGQLLQVWLNGNAEGTIVALLFLARPIRAVGPIVAAFMVAAIAGALGLVLWIRWNEAALTWVGEVGEALHLGIVTGPLVILLAGAIAAGIVAWLALRWLGALYRRGAISDQSIMIDALFLTFAVAHGMGLGTVRPIYALAPFAALLIYKAVARLGARLQLPPAGPDPHAPRLLLLRVFALGKRSERLFGSFGKLWRLSGGTSMIAGPDLVAATVEPHQFMDFIAGSLSNSFIADAAALDARLADSVPSRGCDGRFRVASYFCYDDTWKMTLERLATCHDVVLMDLRGFTALNRGSSFEIRELLDAVDLDRLVLIIDATTDMEALAATAADAFKAISTRSPNRSLARPEITLHRLPNGPLLGVGRLHARVIEAAAARSGRAVRP